MTIPPDPTSSPTSSISVNPAAPDGDDVSSSRSRNIVLAAITIPLMVLVCLGLWFLNGYPVQQLSSDAGTWDLRGRDLSSAVVELNGDVTYAPGLALTPEQFAQAEADGGTGGTVIGQPGSAEEDLSTSRIRLVVDDDTPPMQLVGTTGPAAIRLYANGQLLGEFGHVGRTQAETVESVNFFVRDLPEPINGVIEIVQQIASFSDSHQARHAGYIVGTTAMVSPYAWRQLLTSGIVAGGFMALFFIHFIMWFLFRRYRANLYFALFCLVWFIRTLATGPNSLAALFPVVPWQTLLRVEYLTVPAGGMLMWMIVGTWFPRVAPRSWKIIVGVVSGAYGLAVLFLDTDPLMPLSQAYDAFLGLWLVAGYIRFFCVVRRLSLTEIIVVAAGSAFLLTAVRDTLDRAGYTIGAFGPFARVPMAETGLLLYVLIQAIAMFIATFSDMDAARAAQRRLRDENAALDRVNRLRADLMSTLSHELRTPLAVIMGFAELAVKELRRTGVAAETTADLDAIAAEAGRLAVLVDQAQRLSLSRDAGPARPATAVGDIIGQTARMYAPLLARQDTELDVDIATDLPLVAGNPDELTQVLFNLLTNASKHTVGGQISIKAARHGSDLQITVADDGSGIPPELLPHVFQRGVHGDGDSTGLGLAICREIIESLGGTITMTSAIGVGTTARIELPAAGQTGTEGH